MTYDSPSGRGGEGGGGGGGGGPYDDNIYQYSFLLTEIS